MKFNSLLSLVLLLAPSGAAVAQTARIAHLSHGGSLATLAANEAADNFGNPVATYVDSVHRLTDTTALEYSRRVVLGSSRPAYHERAVIKVSGPNGQRTRQALLERYRYSTPPKLIGFDTVASLPAPKKQKTKRKRSQWLAVGLPTPPQHPEVVLAVVLIVGLGSLGWLLGERRPAQSPAA